MHQHNLITVRMLACSMMVLSTMSALRGDEPAGVARIPNAGPGPVQVSPAGFHHFHHAPAPYCQDCEQGMAGHHGHHCKGGHCPTYYRNVYGQLECDHSNCHLARAVAHCYECKQSPGTGYAPPGKYPIVRTNVGYSKMFPDYWSGNGYGVPMPVYPQVYQPTDTTQLGFYYQTVPTWVPMPGMTPPNPVPAEWHRYGWGGAMGPAVFPHHRTYPWEVTDPAVTPMGEMQVVPQSTQDIAIKPIPESSI